MRVTRLERDVPFIIEVVVLVVLTPLPSSIDDLTARVSPCEGRQRRVLALKDEVTDMRKDVDNLKFINFTSMIQVADDL